MTCRWKWKTVCHATAPQLLMRLMPSAPSVALAVCAIRWPARATAARSSGSISSRSRACARGTTSAWPRVAGLMSMNVTVRASLATIVAGISPATILQNRQSGSVAGIAVDLIHRLPQYAEERMSTTPTEAALHADVAHLAALDRLPCSPGEAQAAAWIAERLRASGADRVRVDEELVHGTYFTPLGILNAVGALGGVAVLGGRRVVGGAAAALAAVGLWQDLTGARKRTLRRFLKRQTTTNVIAEFGPADAAHTLVIHAHHDAARTSFIFDQTLTRLVAEKTPLMEKTDRWPPLMGLVFGGPALVAFGAAMRHRKTVAAGTLAA